MSHLTRRGWIAASLVAGVFLFANWPRAIKSVLTIAGFPFTFATWYGGKAADFHAPSFTVDLLLAIAAIVATLHIFSRTGKKRDSIPNQGPAEST